MTMPTNSAPLWGVFEDLDGAKHVIPCDDEARKLAPHIVHVSCLCQPEWDKDVCVHKEPS